MKKIILIILPLLTLAYTGCRKRDTDHISTVVNVSQPTINLKGEKCVTLSVGDSYDDPGATSIDDVSGAQSDIMAEYTNLDPSTPGVYYMLYTAKNANGYVTNNVRYIAVTDYDDAVDLSGTYLRAATGAEPTLTKVSRAFYKSDDMGGAGIPDAIYLAVINDTTITGGVQFSETMGSEISTNRESLSLSDPITIMYALDAPPTYGTSVRTFVKQ